MKNSNSRRPAGRNFAVCVAVHCVAAAVEDVEQHVASYVAGHDDGRSSVDVVAAAADAAAVVVVDVAFDSEHFVAVAADGDVALKLPVVADVDVADGLIHLLHDVDVLDDDAVAAVDVDVEDVVAVDAFVLADVAVVVVAVAVDVASILAAVALNFLETLHQVHYL